MASRSRLPGRCCVLLSGLVLPVAADVAHGRIHRCFPVSSSPPSFLPVACLLNPVSPFGPLSSLVTATPLIRAFVQCTMQAAHATVDALAFFAFSCARATPVMISRRWRCQTMLSARPPTFQPRFAGSDLPWSSRPCVFPFDDAFDGFDALFVGDSATTAAIACCARTTPQNEAVGCLFHNPQPTTLEKHQVANHITRLYFAAQHDGGKISQLLLTHPQHALP